MRPVISGIATGPEGPVALARVMLDEAPAPVPDVAGLTGEDGAFSLGTVGPGRYVVAVHADGYLPARVDVTVHDSDVTVEARLRPLQE